MKKPGKRSSAVTGPVPRLLAGALLSAFAGHASATNELALQLETSLSTDSNPLRFYDGREYKDTDPALRSGDQIRAGDLRYGATVPLVSEQTRLVLTGSLGKRRYMNDKQLDYHVHASDAHLEFAVNPLLSGRASYGDESRLFQYQDGSITDLDLAHQKYAGVDLLLKISNELTLHGKVYRSTVAYDLPVNQLYNANEKGRLLSLRYDSPTGSLLEGGVRASDSRYPDRTPQQIADLDRAWRENEAYLDAEWKYSVKTTASSHVGVIRRRYEQASEHDTALRALIARATYHYSPKLRLDLQAWDVPSTIVDKSTLYVRSRAVRFDALWSHTEKTKFNASALFQNSEQTLIASLAQAGGAPANRKEQLTRFGLGWSTALDRSLRVFADSFVERARRPADQTRVRQAVVRVGLEYSYENIPGSASRMGLKRYQHPLSSSEAIR